MGEHYFSERPQAAHRPRVVDLVLPDMYLRLHTDRGVFSPDRVDPGTRILLETVPPPPPSGDLLDLGCGYGPLALVMARRAPDSVVWGVDVNERVLALGRRNATAAGLYNVKFVLADEIDPELRFAAIWSNPPIRIGKPALHRLLSSWLGRLLPGGTAHLVVQRHLGADSLQRWLTGQGLPTVRVTSRSGYRVLAASAPVDPVDRKGPNGPVTGPRAASRGPRRDRPPGGPPGGSTEGTEEDSA